MAAQNSSGATHREIYQLLAENGLPGTYTTFYTYFLEVYKMTPAQRARLAQSYSVTLPAIISGGKTGAERAAHDFAVENEFECAGWCLNGRSSESAEKNVLHSNATVIFTLSANLAVADGPKLARKSRFKNPRSAGSEVAY